MGDGVGLQFLSSSQNATAGARYLTEAVGELDSPWTASTLVANDDGVLYDPTEGRVADYWIPSFLQSPQNAENRLEVASYLAPLFPGLLENVPDAIAVYFVGADGELAYYPPIGVQDYLEPDVHIWDAAQFDTALPEKNPERATIWVPPYDDLAQQGKLVSVLAPVYLDDEFFGVVGLDLSLDKFSAQVNDTNPTEHGYAFYVDKAGNLLPTDNSGGIDASISADGNEALAGALPSDA